jgi:transcriptional regulator with XRE-family HTH domain
MPDAGTSTARLPLGELGSLLRSRRERLSPEDVGLPPGTRRRTRGLRREEVARLAAISPTYYTFLEQGREVRPSVQVLDALAAALRLSAAERAHLHALARREPPAVAAPAAVSPALAALVARLDPHPAYVTGPRFDVLAWNAAVGLLWTDWGARPDEERNMLLWMFLDPEARAVMVEWDREAEALLGRFRVAHARHAGDPAFDALAARLQEESPEARAWWAAHAVAALSSGRKRLRHPELGELELTHVVLEHVDAPGQRLVAFTLPDDAVAAVTRLLPAAPPRLHR